MNNDMTNTRNTDGDDFEKVCFVCKRTESKTGKIIKMPGNIEICPDCMQKAMNQMGNANIDFDKMNQMGIINEKGEIDMNKIHFPINPMQEVPERKKLKKSTKESTNFTMDDVPPPHIIKSMLDEFVIGQDRAKKVISVAVYNHYKRVFLDQNRKNSTEGEVDTAASKHTNEENQESVSTVLSGYDNKYISMTKALKRAESEARTRVDKSNILMIGPTGSGKTFLVKTLAKLLDVPLAIADATSLTEAGYIGDDIESVLSKLLQAADNDVERAQCGIVFIDEIDKIAKKKNVHTRDVSGESVQQELLKMLEGSKVEVPIGSNQKNAMSPLTTIDTDNILFICGGAFPDLEGIIKERLTKNSNMGFNAVLRDRYDEDKDIFRYVTTEDIRKFGMIPEFLGRLPITVSLSGLGKEDLVKVLKEPKNAIIKQYVRLLELDEVKLSFTDEALGWIAEQAMEKNTGARALRSIIEEFMLDIMFEIPKDKTIGMVEITKDYLEKKSGPRIMFRGQEERER